MKFISNAFIGFMTLAIFIVPLSALAWMSIKYPNFGLVVATIVVGGTFLCLCAFIGIRVRGYWNL